MNKQNTALAVACCLQFCKSSSFSGLVIFV